MLAALQRYDGEPVIPYCLNPRATEVKVELARLHLRRGRPEVSLAMAREAVQSEPANAEARLVYVRALLTRNDLESAAAELERLVVAYPKSAAVHVQRGILLGRQHNSAGARFAFERALEIDSRSVEAFNGLLALDLVDKQIPAARARVDDWLAGPDVTATAVMVGYLRCLWAARRAIERAHPRRLLDIGCGTGLTTLPLCLPG